MNKLLKDPFITFQIMCNYRTGACYSHFEIFQKASAANCIDVIRIIFQRNQNFVWQDFLNKTLQTACNHEQLETAKELVGMGAEDYGRALMWAMFNDSVDCARFMLDCGVKDLDIALEFASNQGSWKCVQLLIERGATDFDTAIQAVDSKIRDYNNQYPLEASTMNIFKRYKHCEQILQDAIYPE